MRRAWLLALVMTAELAGQQRALPPLAREMLAAHNAVRQPMKLRPLEWSDKLAAWAQEWADTLAAQSEFFHRPKNPYGENLYTITGAQAGPEQVVHAWASEASGYEYKSNACHGVCGHYTQIVWRDTRKVGCAIGRSPGRQVWVCNYDPPGNIVGLRPY